MVLFNILVITFIRWSSYKEHYSMSYSAYSLLISCTKYYFGIEEMFFILIYLSRSFVRSFSLRSSYSLASVNSCLSWDKEVSRTALELILERNMILSSRYGPWAIAGIWADKGVKSFCILVLGTFTAKLFINNYTSLWIWAKSIILSLKDYCFLGWYTC